MSKPIVRISLIVSAFAVLAMIAFVALPFALLMWRSWQVSSYATVHFILPAGFHGPFVIASPVGSKVRRPIAGAQCEFHVPDDGVVIVDDDSVFTAFHFTVISTADGTVSRERPDLSTDAIKGGMVFLQKGSSEDSVARENWFYYGPPGGDKDTAALDRLDDVVQTRIKDRSEKQ